MKISLNWLKDYIDLSGISAEEIVEKITYAGLEVEEVADQSMNFTNMIVGFVKDRKKHPNADKLSLCIVSDGTRDYNVVCGAPNVAAGQKIAFAKIGTIIPNGGFKIEKAKIRGEVSEGMICSERELGISDNHEGIMVLDSSLAEGTELSTALGLDDVTMEINITPNRADALSHIGVARDLCAIFNRPLKYPNIDLNESGKKSEELAAVEIRDSQKCPRYIGKVVSNVEIKESPEWMKKRLKSIGLRPINNVVDVTNYVLHEVGQPLHAFDLDNLAHKKIVVRRAEEGEKFVTLDSKERKMKSSDLMICDAERSVAIAGVMGGENSEVTATTKNILVESAYFNPSSVRKTAKNLALSTDASYRFERGTDYNITLWAAKRAAQLIQQTAGGEIALGEIDAYPNQILSPKVEVRFARINKILGYEIPKVVAERILTNLGFVVVEKSEEKLFVEIPSYRGDVEREIDLIEEVARIYGYNNIPEINKISITLEEKVDQSEFTDRLRTVFNSLGFYEIVTNSMLSENIATKFGSPVSVLNPQSSEMSHIRPSLLPGMLTTVANNLKVSEKDLMLFELGKIINKKNNAIISFDDFEETENCVAIITGNSVRTKWYAKDKQFDLYDLKGIVEVLLSKQLPGVQITFERGSASSKNYKNGLNVLVNETTIGEIGELRDSVAAIFDVNQKTYALEINIDELKKIVTPKKSFNELLKFPKVYRDCAFVLDADIESGQVVEVIKQSSTKLLHNVILFDIFQSESLGKHKKSLAFQLEYFDLARTLTEEEVDKDFRTAIKAVETKFTAQLRGT
ncbi:MAG: phenylalanine--tRNA ligase subunit beta [Stygiobacter sp. RIFOXYC12_FULL_38_8]|nr:MAG: phenylalanine--tRNA ligase subunit beta [Stygiobacter sp. GWC2_38_9]OGV06118.1 MAG: phenylalanine--tRNA ligase subunit beta [Stygiobacter sp. RIFOXYB2_FULL_37_11]OGV16818.1 MAG: phenylalanine--tRNA ligase subunit beta [Stygiobacter sp. RIFOXYC2_FULL_38_25]OGV23470.1 MAG: phenylalanine--tRNA ligase subunit beta [Stygiobacter sp. RIFOXYC12_FULL_38_8]OGV82832.1 MAG: phenylalanine--tRNA ligase subunit beta [Stygiobacter sp. GWF2_38_21]RJQ61714.1 MAG: phenylalanine--tRNA ligase subunit beta